MILYKTQFLIGRQTNSLSLPFCFVAKEPPTPFPADPGQLYGKVLFDSRQQALVSHHSRALGPKCHILPVCVAQEEGHVADAWAITLKGGPAMLKPYPLGEYGTGSIPTIGGTRYPGRAALFVNSGEARAYMEALTMLDRTNGCRFNEKDWQVGRFPLTPPVDDVRTDRARLQAKLRHYRNQVTIQREQLERLSQRVQDLETAGAARGAAQVQAEAPSGPVPPSGRYVEALLKRLDTAEDDYRTLSNQCRDQAAAFKELEDKYNAACKFSAQKSGELAALAEHLQRMATALGDGSNGSVAFTTTLQTGGING